MLHIDVTCEPDLLLHDI